jgi:hypothetical protein
MAQSPEKPDHDHQGFKSSVYTPYAIAIGRLSMTWNDLHENLAVLFSLLCGSNPVNRALAIWNSANFDRAKREMLKAAALSALPNELEKFPNISLDIKWLCDRCDEFENIRNDSVHSPLHFLEKIAVNSDVELEEEPSPKFWGNSVSPNDIFQNTRAKRLAGKDLLLEFDWCHNSVTSLSIYALNIIHALITGATPWPYRSSLPKRPHQNQRRKAQDPEYRIK